MEEISREKIFVYRSWEERSLEPSYLVNLENEILPAFGNATDFIT